VKVTKEKIKIESFSKFKKTNKYIFEKKIIDRKIEIIKSKNSEFEKFLRLATSNKNHFNSVCSAIGYLISSYKNPSLAKAVTYNDSEQDNLLNRNLKLRLLDGVEQAVVIRNGFFI